MRALDPALARRNVIPDRPPCGDFLLLAGELEHGEVAAVDHPATDLPGTRHEEHTGLRIRDLATGDEKWRTEIEYKGELAVAGPYNWFQLYKEGKITLEAAMKASSNPHEFELRIRGIHASSDKTWDAFEETPGDETEAEITRL